MGYSENIGADREPRSARLFTGEMQIEGGAVLPIRVRNLSPRGMGGAVRYAITPGTRARVALTGFAPLDGTITWVRRDRFGIKFDHRIDPGQAKFDTQAIAARDGFTVAPRWRPVTDTKRPPVR